jgi:hypothetical protein
MAVNLGQRDLVGVALVEVVLNPRSKSSRHNEPRSDLATRPAKSLKDHVPNKHERALVAADPDVAAIPDAIPAVSARRALSPAAELACLIPVSVVGHPPAASRFGQGGLGQSLRCGRLQAVVGVDGKTLVRLQRKQGLLLGRRPSRNFRARR